MTAESTGSPSTADAPTARLAAQPEVLDDDPPTTGVMSADMVRTVNAVRTVNGPTRRIVLAVAPETPGEVVDAAFQAAAERGVPLLAVRLWHDPDLTLGGWLRPERTARCDAAAQRARRELDDVLRAASVDHPEVEVTTMIADDDPVPFLAAICTQSELLVVGRSTRIDDGDSPVDALVRSAAWPVLVVPPARERHRGRPC
jgi:hypothetical protein